MNPSSRKLEWIVWGALALTILGIVGAFVRSKLSVIQGPPLPIITKGLPSFTLTNQSGQVVTQKDLESEIHLVDIIFTRCAGPCPKMTRHMAELQSKLSPKPPIKFLTVTTDPDFDSPAILKRYAEKFGADFQRWTFLTGSKAEIRRFARDGLLLVSEEKSPEQQTTPEDLFIHATVFILLDKHGRVRGQFDSTEDDFMPKLTRAVKQLSAEK
jgi:protein SCO1/2